MGVRRGPGPLRNAGIGSPGCGRPDKAGRTSVSSLTQFTQSLVAKPQVIRVRPRFVRRIVSSLAVGSENLKTYDAPQLPLAPALVPAIAAFVLAQ